MARPDEEEAAAVAAVAAKAAVARCGGGAAAGHGGAAHRRAQQPREGEPWVEGALPRRRRPEGRVRAERACVAAAELSPVLAAGQGWMRTYLVAASLVAGNSPPEPKHAVFMGVS
jgi:hypothetical protein